MSQFDLDVRFRPGKEHVVADALSRLPQQDNLAQGLNEFLDAQVASTEATHVYNATLIKMSEGFRKAIQTGYQRDQRWTRLAPLIKEDVSPGVQLIETLRELTRLELEVVEIEQLFCDRGGCQAEGGAKASRITILDLRQIASFTEFFVIADGANQRQVQAIADEINEQLKKQAGRRPVRLARRGKRVHGFATPSPPR